jgi:valyl-tRNA synthetase
VARAVLVHVFDGALRLLHPIVPFITDTLWQRLPSTPDGALLAGASWPVRRAHALGGGEGFETARAAVEAVRAIRAEYGVAPGAKVDVAFVASTASRADAATLLPVIAQLGRATVSLVEVAPTGAVALRVLADGSEVAVPLAGMVDLEKERGKLDTELAGLDKAIGGLEGRLGNESFTAKAPAHVIDGERARLAELRERRDTLRAKRAAFAA